MNFKIVLTAVLAVLPALAQAQPPSAAGELALVTGSVNVAGPNGSRSLGKGDAVYVGDTLLVGANSYASVKFSDGGRILLRPSTDFTVEAYQYTAPAAVAPAAPKAKPAVGQQQAFFRLLRGGFRAISGVVGQSDRQAYRVSTPVATIGIRGTDYEMQICVDDCPAAPRVDAGTVDLASTSLAGLELAQAGVIGGGTNAPGGVLLATNDGTVAMKTSKGEYLVKVGEVAFALSNGQVFMLPAVPDAMLPYANDSPADCE